MSKFAPKSKCQALLAALKGCRDSRDLGRGQGIHAEASRACLDSDIRVANSLIAMYSKCGSMVDARKIFLAMPFHTLASWTALILGYAVNGDSDLALEIFQRLELESRFVDLSSQAYVAALVAIASLASREEHDHAKVAWLEKAMVLHSKAEKNNSIQHIFFSSALVDCYSKCGSLIDARAVFDRMPRHDVVAWTALILGNVENEQCELALELFHAMGGIGIVPNSRTIVAAFMACSGLADRELEEKKRVGSFSKIKALDRAIELHAMAVAMGCDSNIFVANTAVDMFSRCGSLDRARAVFDSIKERSVVSWNALIRGYAAQQDDRSSAIALDLFSQMENPNQRSFCAALGACANLGAIDMARSIHARVSSQGLLQPDPILANCLLDCYARCGSMDDAERVIASMAKESRSFVGWSSIIAGYGRAGDAKGAISALDAMQGDGFRPSATTFVSILHACSHAGQVDRGLELFESMELRFGIQPEIEHYHCVIDLLARSNRVEEAVAMARKMPFAANAVTWRTVLAACRKWRRVEIGEVAFETLIDLGERHAAIYLLMAGIYAGEGMWADRERVLLAMRSLSCNSITGSNIQTSSTMCGGN
ncbi:pentatricopeptide repeat-containing protein At1g11290, chloroplastic-like [Selaginella moellendorffii]|uniref:pentatricopeptide repeat-containing protein At1g11290, chloroplastic-like n=1 Tax=Selaginella moellendorffii TaxID=88036 RepID=UPI000D1C84A5|nr:pentatricopeptide repeat-containing protein At1g11290, chloroplastic-like [Selaginella moellendorffii]|eukprot:XP_024534500.1 pentatricopeptide repeat-containing protein At1g11290, chloroplastic-like [Selaginella moellendorffii]